MRLLLLLSVIVALSAAIEPCPKGCRCTSPPGRRHRHHYHRLLSAYRLRTHVYGSEMAGAGFRIKTNFADDDGREMTCLGLHDMPGDVPSDVKKLTFYGDTKGSLYLRDESLSELADSLERPYGESRSYNQLSQFDKSTFYRSRGVKDISVEGNKIRTIKSGDFEILMNLRKLHMRNNRIREIEDGAFMGLKNLAELDISQNQIKVLGRNVFDKMRSLEILNMAQNRIRHLHSKLFSDLSGVVEIDLSHNYLDDLPENVFFNNDKLKIIKINNNDLTTFRESWFANLRNLETLELRGNKITFIPALQSLKSLTSLSMDKNQIKEIRKETFDSTANLKELRLQYNNITVVEDDSFANLGNLERLYLDNNNIDRLSVNTLNGLHRLKDLGISRNRILEINAVDLTDVKSLSRLDLSHNRIKIIKSQNFFGLQELRELKLDHNEIRLIERDGFVVSSVSTKSRMTWIYLSYNKIATLSLGMLYGLPYVKFLNLGHNEIDSIQNGAFSMLRRLHTMILSHNSISQLDVATFKHLRHLRHVDLADNRIRHLGVNSLLGMLKVEDLNLMNNELDSIPEASLTDTPSLLSLNLRGNKIRRADFSALDAVDRLKYLDLSDNEIYGVQMSDNPHGNLYFLSLVGNNIETLHDDVTQLMTSGGAMHLYDNPWSCDCRLSWLQESRDVSLADADDIVCKRPRHLSGERVMALKPDDLQCLYNDAPSQEESEFYDIDQDPVETAADEPDDDTSVSCGFMKHAFDENKRTFVKALKGDVSDWFVTLFDPALQNSCYGVTLTPEWIFTRSSCWKQINEDSAFTLSQSMESSNGDNSLYPVKADVVENYYYGALDVTLIKVKVNITDDLRVYPCVLSKEGVTHSIKSRSHGVISVPASDLKSRTKVKVKEFVGRVENSDKNDPENLSIKINSERFKPTKFNTNNVPFYFKVGRSRWAFVGFSEISRDSYDTHHVTPVYDVISWIDDIIN